MGSYYHPASTQRLPVVITIVVILDQELLMVHGVSLLILTLDGNIVMYQSVVSTFINYIWMVCKHMCVYFACLFVVCVCVVYGYNSMKLVYYLYQF